MITIAIDINNVNVLFNKSYTDIHSILIIIITDENLMFKDQVTLCNKKAARKTNLLYRKSKKLIVM